MARKIKDIFVNKLYSNFSWEINLYWNADTINSYIIESETNWEEAV